MDPQSLKPNELTEHQLKFGYWYVTHKLALRRAFAVAIGALAALLWLFALGMLVKLFLIDYTRDRLTERAALQTLVNPAAVLAAVPRGLLTHSTQVFAGGRGTTDLVATITNPNSDFWATWRGQFIGANATTTERAEFILPGVTKSVVELGLESPSRGRGARYEIRDLVWHRVNRHQIPDYGRYAAERLALETRDAQFTTQPSPDGQSTLSRVSFSVTNRSGYGYWSVRFLINLYRGTSLVAVNSVELQQIESGETRRAEVVWVQDLAAISKVEIIPEVNILDSVVFMPPRGQ